MTVWRHVMWDTVSHRLTVNKFALYGRMLSIQV